MKESNRRTSKAKRSKDADKKNGINTTSADNEQTRCLAADIQLKADEDKAASDPQDQDQLMREYAKRVEDMKATVQKDLAASKYSFELAKIGYDIYTDIEVYDYDVMLDILEGNGYCRDCADAFIDSFSLTSELSTGSEKLVIRRKEKVETEFMFSKMIERQAEEQRKQAVKNGGK